MRNVEAVLGMVLLTASPCWAHGHASAPGFVPPSTDHSLSEPATQKPFHDWLAPDTPESKNPYEKLSCPQLYVLATQSAQNPDLANAFKDKDCHAL